MGINRMLLTVSGNKITEQWMVSANEHPSIDADITSIPFMSMTHYVRGTRNNPINFSIIDFIGPYSRKPVKSALWEWLNLCFTEYNYDEPNDSLCKRKITLEVLDPIGIIITRYNVYGCYVTDYSGSEFAFENGYNLLTRKVIFEKKSDNMPNFFDNFTMHYDSFEIDF